MGYSRDVHVAFVRGTIVYTQQKMMWRFGVFFESGVPNLKPA